MLRHLISTAVACSVALRAAGDRAEMKSLPGATDGVLVTIAVGVALEAPSAAQSGAREASQRRE